MLLLFRQILAVNNVISSAFTGYRVLMSFDLGLRNLGERTNVY